MNQTTESKLAGHEEVGWQMKDGTNTKLAKLSPQIQEQINIQDWEKNPKSLKPTTPKPNKTDKAQTTTSRNRKISPFLRQTMKSKNAKENKRHQFNNGGGSLFIPKAHVLLHCYSVFQKAKPNSFPMFFWGWAISYVLKGTRSPRNLSISDVKKPNQTKPPTRPIKTNQQPAKCAFKFTWPITHENSPIHMTTGFTGLSWW